MILPIKTEKFIAENKLPNTDALLIHFYLPENFRNYEDRFIIIGDQDCGGYIGVDEMGCVYTIEKDTTQMNNLYRFISSSLEQLVKQLILYKNLSSLPLHSNEEEMEIVANRFSDSLIEIDEKAVAYEENFWSVIIEQILYGLL